jgi:predicted outer membrane protein
MTSCKKNEPLENALKSETFNKNDKEEIEAFFFIATANVSKSLISKSQIAQQKSSEIEILELSKKIESQQSQILQDVTKMANKKLIIITEINATHKRDLYELLDATDVNFKTAYVDSMTESLKEQIGLFESVSKETNDKTILKFVLQYLPEQYQLLRETEKLEIN